MATNLDSTVLRWSHGEEVSISPLNYVYNQNDVYPLVLEDALYYDGFLVLTIRSAELDDTELTFTADLLVDMEVLFALGYRSLQCGSLTVKTNFTFMELDIEGWFQS